MVQGAGIQRRVLNSSRVLPRGEKNGRKIYQSTDESVSVCDATWRPNLNGSEDKHKTDSENHSHKYRNGVLKKKLRFEDQVTELNERCSPGQIKNSAKEINNKSEKQDESHPSSSVPSMHSRANSNGNLERKTKGTSADYCRLCEARDEEYSNESYRIKKKDNMHNNHDETTSTSKFYAEHDNFSSHDELCFLCHRYRGHKCICDDNYCKICDKHLNCSQEGMTENEHSLHQRGSASAQVAGGENHHIPLTKIPYEPRTKFVKNLKEKLETTYMKDNSNVSCLQTFKQVVVVHVSEEFFPCFSWFRCL